MKRFIPLMIASGFLMIGSSGLVVHYQLNADGPEGWHGWLKLNEAKDILRSEAERSNELDERLTEVGRRLQFRVEATRQVLSGEIDLPTLFEIYGELNLEAHDPLHHEDGWHSEFERLSWIAHQVRINIDSMSSDLKIDRLESRRIEIGNDMAWMLADME